MTTSKQLEALHQKVHPSSFQQQKQAPNNHQTLIMFLCDVILLLNLIAHVVTASGPASHLVLRVRKPDGSMERIAVPKDELETTTLSSILSTFASDENDDMNNIDDAEEEWKCQIGNGPARPFVDVEDNNQSIASFNVQNGSIINILPSKRMQQNKQSNDESSAKESKDTLQRYTTFDPFPDIAKSSHSSASRRSRALSRLPSKRSMSYGDISKLRDHMHTIEPQGEGPIKRIYMCLNGAQRFKDNCTIMPSKKQIKAGKKEIKYANRCAVLFGSVNTERVDQSKRKARTSLSTPLYEMEMCKVIKVQAVWEPLSQPSVSGKPYDQSKLWGGENKDEYERAVQVADMLGLKMVGWIYSYGDDRLEDNHRSDYGEESLPVFGRDVVFGAMGQIDNMERIGREDGCQFVTLALDAKTGATEAFQLSDVSVQMVAEGKVKLPDKSERYLEPGEPVIVDSKESSQVDSVLCLVNTAMLSHEGRYSGGSPKSSIKKAGTLTTKSKKALLKHVDGDSEKFVKSLCDFDILMALTKSLKEEESAELCALVKKYARGQRKAAQPSKQLKLALANIIGG